MLSENTTDVLNKTRPPAIVPQTSNIVNQKSDSSRVSAAREQYNLYQDTAQINDHFGSASSYLFSKEQWSWILFYSDLQNILCFRLLSKNFLELTSKVHVPCEFNPLAELAIVRIIKNPQSSDYPQLMNEQLAFVEKAGIKN